MTRMRTPNPIRSDGYVMQHFVPCPTMDSPEEILEYYRQWMDMCIFRLLRINQQITPVEWNRACNATREAQEKYNLACLMTHSFRYAVGNGLFVSVPRSNRFKREIPLTHPGFIHLWDDNNPLNILCADDAHAYESAVTLEATGKGIPHVNCPKCLKLYWRNKRRKKRKQVARLR